MNPEDRALVELTLKLSEDNNKILQKMMRAQRRATIYGFIKLLIIVIPLVIGYLYLEPYLELIGQNLQSVQNLFESR